MIQKAFWGALLLAWSLFHRTAAQDTIPLPSQDTAIYQMVETMPRFWGCEALEGGVAAQKHCADAALTKFFHSNVKLPAICRESCIEGMVVIGFVVEKDGRVSNAQVLRDPGGGLGDAVLDVLKTMQASPHRWTPGRQGGVPVRVKYLMPFHIKYY